AASAARQRRKIPPDRASPPPSADPAHQITNPLKLRGFWRSPASLYHKKYAKIRTRLPLEKGEVKGRLLNEKQVAEVIAMLARNDVLFELTVTDLEFHTESDVDKYKKTQSEGMLARVDQFRAPGPTARRRRMSSNFEDIAPIVYSITRNV
ncbi:MAG: hypothetical protein WB646_19095, partial [Steroidobacteraceae bacterium]